MPLDERPTARRRVVLHLGMHKTGSSSIQNSFRGYADGRIAYADLGIANHSRLLAVAFNRQADGRHSGTADPDARREARRAARRRVAEALDGPSPSLILSGEKMWTMPAEAIGRLVDFVARRTDRVEALVYIRGPADYAASAFQQRVQKGLSRLDPEALAPPYRERAERWTAALGREPAYVPFDQAAFHEGDLLADFAHRLGLDPGWLRRHARRSNESLSAEATAVLFALRTADRRTDRFGPGARINGRLVEELRSFGDHRFVIDPAVLDPVLAERADDMAWIEGRMGRPFPPARRDGVAFATAAGVLAYAAKQERSLARHLAGGRFAGPPEGEGVLGLLRGLRSRVAADEARLAGAPVGA